VCPSTCPSFLPFFRLSVYFLLSICLSVYQSLGLSVRPSFRPSVWVSVSSYVYQSVCPFIHLSVLTSVRPSVCLSVCLSIYPSIRLSVRMDQLGYRWTGFDVLKICLENSRFINIGVEQTVLLHEDLNILMISRWITLTTINVSDKKVAERIKRHDSCSRVFLSRKSHRSWDNVGRSDTAGQSTDDNMGHARCMLDTQVYKHTLTIFSTYCFFFFKVKNG
jgi:hypothetical protein